jgi:hypothetical protein
MVPTRRAADDERIWTTTIVRADGDAFDAWFEAAHMVSQGGRSRDSVVFSIVAAEWPRVRRMGPTRFIEWRARGTELPPRWADAMGRFQA